MVCTMDKELDFTLTIPPNYMPSSNVEELSFEQWIQKVKTSDDLREDLKVKILDSLNRMPTLEDGQMCSVSYSGGKDSEAIFMLARMKYPQDQLISLFADTEDEWPETYEAIDDFKKWIGVDIVQLDSVGIHNMLRYEKPYWPRPGTRHCTKNLKMLPQRDYLDRMGFEQVRKDKSITKYRKSLGGHATGANKVAPLTISGERKAESANRSKLPYDSRDDVIMRMTHRPVLDWNIQDVWDFIFWMQAPINKVYTLGIKRVACAGCIFASPSEIHLLGEHYPSMLEEWVKTEESIGHPWKGKNASMKGIYEDLKEQGRLGIKAFHWSGTEFEEGTYL